MRVGIVGMGRVGASVASSLLHHGIAAELLLCDAHAALAEGEAMDLAHGAAFFPPATVRAAPLHELIHADAVVITAGRAGGPDESRLDLLSANAAIVADIARTFVEFRGLLVVVTNPVDLMTRVAVDASGLPPGRVIGTGTMLDTARLRVAIGRELDLDPRSIHAQVMGEHGDSEVVLWSAATVGGRRLADWPGWTEARQERIAAEVRQAAYEIIARKGSTNHAIGLATAALLRWALRPERRVLTVSRVHQAPWPGVALSLPAVVGTHGATEAFLPEMSPLEREALDRSAALLARTYASIQTP